MNLHVHICVFLFIFNLIPPAKYIVSFATAFYSSLQTSYHNFLKTQNKCTHFNFTHVCTLTHVNPHTNTPRFTHLDIHMYTYHWDITHSILEYSYAQDSKFRWTIQNTNTLSRAVYAAGTRFYDRNIWPFTTLLINLSEKG